MKCFIKSLHTFPSERLQPGGHNNPVEAGFVEKAEDWLYSSAGNFYGKKGLIELSYII